MGLINFTNGTAANANIVNSNFDYLETTFKNIFDGLFGDSVINGCEVTAQSTPDQSVQVSEGKVIINGVSYSVSADSTVNLANADSSNPRYDIVSVGADGLINTTEGTAAASPVVPTLPSDEVPLAVIYRAHTDNVIGSGEISDSRRLIGTPYSYVDNDTYDENSDASFYDKKTVTIPAFRCQKRLRIRYNLFGEMTNNTSATATGIIYSQISVNGDIKDTGEANWRFYQDTTDREVFNCDNLVREIVLTSSDIDFSQPTTIVLSIKGDSQTNYDVTAKTNLFVVEGE